jgi:hypothetical protein
LNSRIKSNQYSNWIIFLDKPSLLIHKTSISEPQPKDHRIFPNENQSNKFNLLGVMSKSLKFSLQIIAEEQKSGKTIQRVNEKILWLKNEEKYFLLAIRKPINIPIMNGVKNCSGPIL